MNVSKEINDFANPSDKDALKWLFARYHMSDQWRFVAKSTLVKYGTAYYECNRIWSPTPEGWILYNHRNELDK